METQFYLLKHVFQDWADLQGIVPIETNVLLK